MANILADLEKLDYRVDLKTLNTLKYPELAKKVSDGFSKIVMDAYFNKEKFWEINLEEYMNNVFAEEAEASYWKTDLSREENKAVAYKSCLEWMSDQRALILRTEEGGVIVYRLDDHEVLDDDLRHVSPEDVCLDGESREYVKACCPGIYHELTVKQEDFVA
jgi:hypothetical protein